MPKKGADTKVRRIAREIIESVDDPDLEGMLYEVQSAAISLSVSTSELISLMKRRDPEYAAAIEAMENTQDVVQEPDEADESDDVADGGTQEESDEAESAGESDEPEDKDEKKD